MTYNDKVNWSISEVSLFYAQKRLIWLHLWSNIGTKNQVRYILGKHKSGQTSSSGNLRIYEKMGPGFGEDWASSRSIFSKGKIHSFQIIGSVSFLPDDPAVRLSFWSVRSEVCHYFLKEGEVTLPCSYWSISFLASYLLILKMHCYYN